jgi:hypothetical protein
MVSFCLPPRPDEPDVRVVVRWRTGCASYAEIVALRQLVPELRDRPAADVFREARDSTEWVLATCEPDEARRVREQAERAGLLVVVEPAPLPVRRVVPDDEAVAELTANGRAVSDFFLMGGLACSVTGDELTARCIDDGALSAATTAYLRRVGAREYGSYQEFVADHSPEAT